MVLRALLGEGDPAFTASPALDPGQVVLVGIRAIDPAEQAAITGGLAVLTDDPATSLSHASHLYVHVDLDVLDPSEFSGLNYPEPGGLSVADLVSALRLSERVQRRRRGYHRMHRLTRTGRGVGPDSRSDRQPAGPGSAPDLSCQLAKQGLCGSLLRAGEPSWGSLASGKGDAFAVRVLRTGQWR